MPPSEPPRTIGRYEVERLLGQGGMGRVWLARDTVLGRRVAIKVLRDDLALPPSVREELVQRMRHEARAAAAVSHPNIVTLHDMGEDDVVGLYLVFEYVPGRSGDGPESLRDRLRGRASLPLAEVATLAKELGSALSFAHEAGVIHRDIKPENVLFSRTGAKIADFGIARIPESTITRANTVLGTPAYTSPEALANGEFGPRSDQFSLAAALYEATTGVRAFGADDPIATAGKVSSEPPPPLHPGLGSAATMRALTSALTRGLAKDPAARFPSCASLGDAVARAVERPLPSDAPPPEATLLSVDTTSVPRIAIDIERTPLSSRARLGSDRPPPLETPARTSIMVRKKTQRLQNVIAGCALLVLVVLVLIGGKKSDPDGAAARDAAKVPTGSSPAHAPPPPPHPRATVQTPHKPAAAVVPVVDDAGARDE